MAPKRSAPKASKSKPAPPRKVARPANKAAARSAGPEPIEALIGDLPQGLCILGPDRRVVFANAAFRRHLGLRGDRARKGTPVESALTSSAAGSPGAGADGPDIAAALRAIEKQERFACDVAMSDGRAVEISGAPLRKRAYGITCIDVTERRRAEAVTQTRQQRLLDAFESFDEGFALFDADDRLVMCNSGYREMYASIGDKLREGVSFEELVWAMTQTPDSPVPPERAAAHVASRMAYHRNPSEVLDAQRRSGRWIRMLDRRMEGGWTVAIRVDITDIKRREAILSVVNDTAARLLSGTGWREQVEEMMSRLGPATGVSRVTLSRNAIAPDGVYMQEDIFEWDAPGVRRLIDDEALRNVVLKDSAFQDWRARRARGEVIYALTRDLPHDQRAWFEIQGVKAAIRVPIMVEKEWWGTAGFDQTIDEHEWQSIEIDALRAATGLIALAIVRDRHDTERRRIEAALRESEQRFRDIAEAHPFPVVMAHTANDIICYASPAMLSLFGGIGLPGMRGREIFADGAERKRFLALLAEAGHVDSYELQLRKADGTVFPASITARPINWDDQPAIIAGIFDLSVIKRAEEQIARQREALAHSEKLTALGSLLAGVAHELNNPLSVVLGQSSMLRDQAQDPAVVARAERIRNAADRCARIVRTFLAMARRRPPEVTAIALNAVVEATLELLAYNLRTADVEVTQSLAPDLPPLMADSDQINQVVANLLVNAQQALVDHPQPRRLRISTALDRAANQVTLAIADNGPGIPKDIRARVFEPFFTTKPTGVGTGLGLSMCHGIVESHGGSISLEETPGGGATFIVRLPVRPRIAAAERAGVAEELASPGTGRILVVDDEPEMAQTLAEILGGAGHRVDIASDGRRALEFIAGQRYDLVLSDLRMPVLDGPGLYRAIKEKHPALAERVLFITGDSLARHITAFLAETRAECIEKPLSPQAVRETVARRLAAQGVKG